MQTGNFIGSTLIIGVLIGGFVLLLIYIVRLFKADTKRNQQSFSAGVFEQQQELKKKLTQNFSENSETVVATSTPSSSTCAKRKGNRKKQSNWIGKSDKKTYSHPWLETTFKGHTGQILDMDVSKNGKYVASCAEEELDPGGEQVIMSTPGKSNENHPNESPSSGSQSDHFAYQGLSRRQRKNRRRDDFSQQENDNGVKPKPKRPIVFVNNNYIVMTRKKRPYAQLKQYSKLNMSDSYIECFLRSYLLSLEQMLTLGFPIESYFHPGKTVIFKSDCNFRWYTANDYRIDVNNSKFDVNAREFVPRISEGGDSGNGSSGNSSDIEDGEALNLNAVASNNECAPNSDDNSIATYDISNIIEGYDLYGMGEKEEHQCVRCGRYFRIGLDYIYITREKCFFHWGKLRYVSEFYESEYECCGGRSDSLGCSTCRFHVWNGVSAGFNGPYDEYMFTRPRKTPPPDGTFGVYALDCEMCYTARGLELAKITVISLDGRIVYDAYVRPDCEIIDYNTRFSGITPRTLSKRNSPKTLREVQSDLMGFINADTILIGHGLENDLKALRIMHPTVIDTGMVFPNYTGYSFRHSLKFLTSYYLKRDIQQCVHGHNSIEDARACMELMLWRVRKDFKSLYDSLTCCNY